MVGLGHAILRALAQLEVRHRPRRGAEAAELSRESRQQAARKVTYYWDDDGSLVIKARLPAETGTLVLRALEAAEADVPLPDPDVSAETSPPEQPPRAARRADALGLIAESFLAHGAEALNGGERHQIVVHVEHSALRRREPGRCELEHGPALPVESARRLACDASVVTVVEDGETKLSNLVSLCRFHHRQVHEGRIAVQRLDDGAWRFVKPDGEACVSSAPGHTWPLDVRPASPVAACDGTELVAAHRAPGREVDSGTAVTRWRGERMDHGLAIEVLLQRAARAGTFPRIRQPNGAPARDAS